MNLTQDIYDTIILASVQAEPELRRRRFVWSHQNGYPRLTIQVYYSNRNDFQYVMYQTSGDASISKYIHTGKNYARVWTFFLDLDCDAEATLRAAFEEADAAAYQQLCLKQNTLSSVKDPIKSVAADMRASIQDDPDGLGTWYIGRSGSIGVTTRRGYNLDKCNGGDYHEYIVYSPDAYGRGIWRQVNPTSSDFGYDKNAILFPAFVPLEKLLKVAARYARRTAAHE